MPSGMSSSVLSSLLRLAPSKQMPNLISDFLSRPADIFLPTWSRGRPSALDVHVISLLQQQILGEAASTPGHALQVGIQWKLTSHLSACLRSLGKAIAQRVDASVCTMQLFHRTAIALCRGTPPFGFTDSQPFPPLWTV